jgi:hypothetical protein
MSLGFSNLVFANSEVNVLKSDIIIEDENTNLLISIDDLITPQAGFKPTNLRADWAGLVSRSSFSNKSGSTMLYNNSGNHSNAMYELTKMGENVPIKQQTNSRDGSSIFIKETSEGTVTLYRSTSETAGAQRPTLQFLDDKIRFLGN